MGHNDTLVILDFLLSLLSPICLSSTLFFSSIKIILIFYFSFSTKKKNKIRENCLEEKQKGGIRKRGKYRKKKNKNEKEEVETRLMFFYCVLVKENGRPPKPLQAPPLSIVASLSIAIVITIIILHHC